MAKTIEEAKVEVPAVPVAPTSVVADAKEEMKEEMKKDDVKKEEAPKVEEKKEESALKTGPVAGAAPVADVIPEGPSNPVQ